MSRTTAVGGGTGGPRGQDPRLTVRRNMTGAAQTEEARRRCAEGEG